MRWTDGIAWESDGSHVYATADGRQIRCNIPVVDGSVEHGLRGAIVLMRTQIVTVRQREAYAAKH